MQITVLVRQTIHPNGEYSAKFKIVEAQHLVWHRAYVWEHSYADSWKEKRFNSEEAMRTAIISRAKDIWREYVIRHTQRNIQEFEIKIDVPNWTNK